MAHSERGDWRLPRGYQSRDHLQLTLWPDVGQQYLDTRAAERHLGRLDDDAEAALWRALQAARNGIVDEDEVDSDRIRE